MEQKQEKVFIKLASSEDYEIEKVWASTLDDGLHVIDNVPFFSDEISYQDIVKTKYNEKYELLEIVKIYRPSNRFQTRFIISGCTEKEKKAVLLEVGKHDCIIEHGKNGYFSISLSLKESPTKFELTLQRFVKLGWLTYDGAPFDAWESKNA
jgi:hypothetical protein